MTLQFVLFAFLFCFILFDYCLTKGVFKVKFRLPLKKLSQQLHILYLLTFNIRTLTCPGVQQQGEEEGARLLTYLAAARCQMWPQGEGTDKPQFYFWGELCFKKNDLPWISNTPIDAIYFFFFHFLQFNDNANFL
ncbi:hypothetical protein AB205_0059200 [Aquarana catesbeiana]|uniref:Uncharacterized protein n=1 Tax=Aquarana catesbeiana TaxID=8400 RepID=A0A2G9SNA4_AQUCT|nr:hypothetical protein AB205_0059200 [Aquarana catesbeiana]